MIKAVEPSSGLDYVSADLRRSRGRSEARGGAHLRAPQKRGRNARKYCAGPGRVRGGCTGEAILGIVRSSGGSVRVKYLPTRCCYLPIPIVR